MIALVRKCHSRALEEQKSINLELLYIKSFSYLKNISMKSTKAKLSLFGHLHHIGNSFQNFFKNIVDKYSMSIIAINNTIYLVQKHEY